MVNFMVFCVALVASHSRYSKKKYLPHTDNQVMTSEIRDLSEISILGGKIYGEREKKRVFPLTSRQAIFKPFESAYMTITI